MTRIDITTTGSKHPTKALKEKCKAILDLGSHGEAFEGHVCYAIGVHVNEVMADECNYGTRAVPYIGKVCGLGPVTLQEYAAIARGWSPAEFETLSKMYTSWGAQKLTVKHLAVLAKIHDPAARAALTHQYSAGDGQFCVSFLKAVHANACATSEQPPMARVMTPKDHLKIVVWSLTAWVHELQTDIEALGKLGAASVSDAVGHGGLVRATAILGQLDARVAELLATLS